MIGQPSDSRNPPLGGCNRQAAGVRLGRRKPRASPLRYDRRLRLCFDLNADLVLIRHGPAVVSGSDRGPSIAFANQTHASHSSSAWASTVFTASAAKSGG